MELVTIEEAIKNGGGKIDYMPPSRIIEYLEEQGFEDLEDMDSNGWDHDFWIYLMYGGDKWCFSGSWYYGGYQLNKV